MMLKDLKHLMIPGTSLMMCPAASEDVCVQQSTKDVKNLPGRGRMSILS